VLCDTSIRRRLNSDSLIIRPWPSDGAIQPASVDLTLGEGFKNVYGDNVVTDEDGSVVLDQGDFLLGTTTERVGIPDDLVARVEGKSSLGRRGLLVHATAGFIDPGFKGQVTLEFYNISPRPFILKPGIFVCQLSFDELDEPAERPYGTDGLGSHYQNQVGVKESAL
jgi:dCTP deaminase